MGTIVNMGRSEVPLPPGADAAIGAALDPNWPRNEARAAELAREELAALEAQREGRGGNGHRDAAASAEVNTGAGEIAKAIAEELEE